MFIQEVDEQTSRALQRVANAIEKDSAEELSSWDDRAEEIRKKISIEGDRFKDGANREIYTEMRLCASLLDLASDLEQRARSTFSLDADIEKATRHWSIGAIVEGHGTVTRID
jgi:multidrug resistance protein MdtO